MSGWCHRLAIVAIGTLGALGLAAAPLVDPLEVRRLLDAGAYAPAEQLARDWASEVEARDGPESLALTRAWDVLLEILDRNGRAAAPETLELAERVVRLKERFVGKSHPETAIALHNLGVIRARRGAFTDAVALHERALAIRRASFGDDDPQLASSLDELALALIQLQKFDDADRRLTESFRIREKRLADAPLALARTLGLIGLLYRSSGTFANAVAPLERALALRGTSTRHPETATLLEIRGDVSFLLGDIRQAQATWSNALSILEETLRPDHPAFAEPLRKLSLAAYSLGSLTTARELAQRGLYIGERSLAPCDPAFTGLLSSVAISRRADGDYAQARQLYRRMRQTIERCSGVNVASATSDAYATALYNEAGIARATGDFSEAERLYRAAIAVWSRGLGQDHPFVARGLNDLADVASARQQFTRSRNLYERVLASRRSRLGEAHPDVAETLTDLARTLASSGQRALALRYLKEAATIYEKAGAGSEPEQVAYLLELRGTLQAREGDYTAARASVAGALAERERIFGATHPKTARTRATLAELDYALGSADEALRAAIEAEEAGREHFQFTIRYLPERQAMAYAAGRPRALDLAISIAATDSAQARQVLDAVIRSRGIVLDELGTRSHSSTTADAQLSARTTALAAARQRFANLVVRSLEESVSRALLDQARAEKEELERDLAEMSAAARAELRRAAIGLTEVQHALPPGAALISYVRFQRSRPVEKTRTIAAPPTVYGAFVIVADQREPFFVALGSASTIDRAIRAWRTEAGLGLIRGPSDSAMTTYREAGRQLRTLIWDPVAVRIAGTERVFIVPDGALNLVNFGALPVGPQQYLVERATPIHYLSTERDLIVSPDERSGATGLLALGGANFDSAATVAHSANSTLRGTPCGTLQSMVFGDLPATRREINEVASLWKSAGSVVDADHVQLSVGRQATERAFKRNAPGRRVLHLATHGFFLGGDCEAAAPGTRAVGRVTPATTKPARRTDMQNPLLVSGLAFAGANRRARANPDQDDGILTAEEISAMSLQGTEWAVLSACDTGLGEVKAGEGVFGLRRAFQIAGVRTVIMSLWSVEDEATRQWMRALYEARLNQHLDTAESVRAASLRVLRDRRAKHLSTHPFYWGAFVSAGDWR